MSVEERDDVAYHEACHTIIGWSLEHVYQLFKVTFIPRSSGAFGYAQGSINRSVIHGVTTFVDDVFAYDCQLRCSLLALWHFTSNSK